MANMAIGKINTLNWEKNWEWGNHRQSRALGRGGGCC